MEQNIILLFGSESDERLVSVASAQALALALGSPTLWFWHKDGPIYAPLLEELLSHESPFIREFLPTGKPLFKDIAEALASTQATRQTFVLATHGGKGENGYVQALLEKHGHPFTGSNAKSSERAFNKIQTKGHLTNFAIKMAPHLVFASPHRNLIPKLEDFLALHKEIVVKPIAGGSSIGCHFIRNVLELQKVFAALNVKPGAYMAEKMLHGRELTVGVIESEEGPMGLPVTEIALASDRDFDYDGKYLGLGTRELTPADLEESLAREAQRMAVAAHVALELEGYSRTDMMLTADGLYFLETNTLPGLTKQSLVPQQLAAAHITLREFLNYQIKLARERTLKNLNRKLQQENGTQPY